MTAEWWDYSGRTSPAPFGSAETYELGLTWLAQTCKTIEDWGAGLAWGRQYVPGRAYTAIDFSETARPFTDVHADLRLWVSSPDGIFMRHVLEHNDDWALILANALESFAKRFCLVTFVPFADRTAALRPDHPVRDIAFRKEDLTRCFGDLFYTEQDIVTATQYGAEHLFYIERAGSEDERVTRPMRIPRV